VVDDVATGGWRPAYRAEGFVDVAAIAQDQWAVAFALDGEIYIAAWP